MTHFFLYLSFPNSPKQTQCKCILLPTAAKRHTVPVMFSVWPHSTFTAQILYKLYSLQLNCTYSNHTEAVATCPVAQQQRNCPAVVFWSGVQQVVLYYIYRDRQSYPVIRFFNEIQFPNNALSQFHSAFYHIVWAHLSYWLGWRKSGAWRDDVAAHGSTLHQYLPDD
jgi:hypothetical protein